MLDDLTGIFRVAPCSDEVKRRLVGVGKASHATDAFVAALTALVYEEVTDYVIRRPDTEGEERDARREGWIFFPQNRSSIEASPPPASGP